MLEVYELQMAPLAEYIYQTRTRFIEAFLPYFQDIYQEISGQNEFVQLRYISQLQTRNLAEAYPQTRQRDLILGWTSQGIHKDELEMTLQTSPDGEAYPLKRVGSQGQQKTYLLAMKLAQAVYLSSVQTEQSQHKQKPILLLDDIFDKLDSERVARIIHLVQDNRFGQIFLTDTDRQHLSQLLPDDHSAKLFEVQAGKIAELEYSPL